MHRTSKGVSPSFKQAPRNQEWKTEIKINTVNKTEIKISTVAAMISLLSANQAALYGTADPGTILHEHRAWSSLCCTECFISGREGNSRAAVCQFHTPALELLSEHPVPVCLTVSGGKQGHRAVLLQPPASTAFPSSPAALRQREAGATNEQLLSIPRGCSLLQLICFKIPPTRTWL